MKRETPSEGEPAGGPAPTTLVDIVFPGAVNHHGTLFGGAGLAFMDRVAFVAATRHGRVPFVTASCERVDFRKPAYIGEIVSFTAMPVWAGRRSLTVEVEMAAESILASKRQVCTRGVFHMVAVPGDDGGEGWTLPPLPTSHPTEADGEVRMADVVFADQTNSSGSMFGGDALAFMTKVAFVAASRHCRRQTVLASSERIDFHHPIRLGSIVEVVARVVSTGRSSMRIGVELWSEELLTGLRRQTAKGLFVMVAVDAEHRPVAVIPVGSG
ncbi:acyl-CoA thioesterase [Rhizobium daejeonense]|uniref:Acyl-CoA thioesterase n=1 Tax=Rhizobium daejeonense TaxID=240521 RepID=A0A6M1SDH4_9HYPH|nr:acyl-CoA thioesterase [Rhizobium daejeonense]NGO66298.1 acyl-CoA thioesterase [Rhizobium daejeonense]